MSDEGKELLGKLGTMFAYAMAHMQTIGVSKEKQGEFKIAHRQIRQLIIMYSTLSMKSLHEWARQIFLDFPEMEKIMTESKLRELGVQLQSQLIQQKPEVDEAYVEEKAGEILRHDKHDSAPLYVARYIVKQIISDVRGGKS